MKIRCLIVFLIGASYVKKLSAQDKDSTVKNTMPNIMLDVSYSNRYAFLNSGTEIPYSNGTVLFKLKNDVEMSLMGTLTRNPKLQHNKLYGGLGFNISEYRINRKLYTDPQGSGHFPVYYTYTPNRLEYRVRLLRINIQLNHSGFYKRWLLFQKFGLAYTFFTKTSPDVTRYQEQYGSSYPVKDPAHITPENPDGWYFDGDYTSKKTTWIFLRTGSVFFTNSGLGTGSNNLRQPSALNALT